MISREPTLERLATAQRYLLEPFGLDESHLRRALAEITTHRATMPTCTFSTPAPKAGAWKRALSKPAPSASTKAWACAL